MSNYWMNVRAVEAPHEVLGRLIVPHAAVVGDMPVVNFETRRSSDCRDTSTFKTVAINVNLFVMRSFNGDRAVVRSSDEFALVVPRDKWAELKELIA